FGGKRFRYDIATQTRGELARTNSATNLLTSSEGPSAERRRERGPERGRQFTSAISPDTKWKAFYRDRNVWLSDTNGSNAFAITIDGNEKSRVKFGSASWVY